MAENKPEMTLEDLLKEEGSGGAMPTRKQMLDMLEGSEMSPDMKEQLKMLLRGGTPELLGSTSTILAVMFVMLLFTTIFFFGYKLYKSLKDKDLKKEEKKKAKLLKKKK